MRRFWIKRLSASMIGLILLFLSDLWSGLAYLDDLYGLLPGAAFILGMLLLFPLAHRMLAERTGRLRLLVVYPVFFTLLAVLNLSIQAFHLRRLTLEDLQVSVGQCTGISRLILSTQSNTALLQSLIDSSSPAKQYFYGVGEQTCRWAKVERAVASHRSSLCPARISEENCLRKIAVDLEGKHPRTALESFFFLSIAHELFGRESTRFVDRLEIVELALRSTAARRAPHDWITSLKTTNPRALQERMQLAGRFDVDEWKRIALDLFLGKLPAQSEAALVLWADHELSQWVAQQGLAQVELIELQTKSQGTTRSPAQVDRYQRVMESITAVRENLAVQKNQVF